MFRFAPSLMPASVSRIGMVVLACAATALAGCGGGNRAKEYAPSRMVSFGDENSAFADIYLPNGSGAATPLYGLAYTVNSVVYTSTLVCDDTASSPAVCQADKTGASFPATATSVDNYILDTAFPSTVDIFERGLDTSTSAPLQRTMLRGYSCGASNNWVQYVAGAFGMHFRNSCSPTGAAAVSYAADGADVAAIVAQVSAHRGELGEGVLVTLMGGQKDIIDLYRAVHGGPGGVSPSPTGMTEDQAVAELKARAAQLAGAVGVIFNSGAKVIVALTPDLGQSPLAATEGSSTLLSKLTKAFNDTFYIENIARNYNDGRKVVGVNSVYITEPSTRSSAYVYTTAACDMTKAVAYAGQLNTPGTSSKPADGVVYCTSDRLISGASVSTYIWADDTHFAPAGHVQIGSTAYNRAANQF